LFILNYPSKWDANVDNIMKLSDPAVEKQLGELTRTQVEMEKSTKAAAKAE